MRVLCFWIALQSVAVANTLLFYEAQIPAQITIDELVVDGFLEMEMDLTPDFRIPGTGGTSFPNIFGLFDTENFRYSVSVGIQPLIVWHEGYQFVPGEPLDMTGNVGRVKARDIASLEPFQYESVRAENYSLTVDEDFSLTIHGGQLTSSEIVSSVMMETTVVQPRILIAGDADKDGDVDFADFLRLSRWYFHGEGFRGWTEGDFTGDGFTLFEDFLLLAANFNRTTVTAVPEPNMSALLCSLLYFRKKRQRRESNPPCRQLEY